jgi:ubiquinone/menaquinone biosynthesis C-methylase UbiE
LTLESLALDWRRKGKEKQEMGKTATSRDWSQIYAIYGVQQWQTLVFLLLHALLFGVLSVLYLLYFDPIRAFFESILSVTISLPGGAARFAAGFTGSVTALSAVCLLFAAANFFYSAVPLHHAMALRMLSFVDDWSTVKHALDLGCGRGILLNAVATQLKKEGSSGRVVGLDRSKATTLRTLRTAKLEGVGEYVTCREGDVRRLPFADNSFDVVVSGVFLHTVGKEHGRHRTVEAAAERMRVVGEVVRVLKPGGVGVVWDLMHVPEYARRLQDLKMEEIKVSERVTAFMVSSHIVSFRKPRQHVVGPAEVRLDWRC